MKAPRVRTLFWLLAAVVLLAVLTGAASVFRLPLMDGLMGRQQMESPTTLREVECLGRVDIEGGRA